ncbi:outer membrane lipoprotein chaperone LolA [Thalassotalea sp. LPB0316]|uniref:outer membrane lipoprotein chaperone LolA n=1 Tax=Thalassotalea sp. LPB0316 TaxID=2769490 RepID=UPI001868B05A|nr:outer membrane lipoprotein chaperone LolA [Thalassotalea sp. LPB0316]QOL25024.1 outer membrane lipoprotein chaperone LolA [Thalassotalea sp. LPB0316]
MKKLLLPLVLGFSSAVVSVSCFAQSQSQFTTEPNSVASAQIKQALQAKLSKLDGFSADFSQRVIDAEGQEIANGQGQLTVEKPNKVHWHTQSPDETLIIANGETLWFYDPFIEQVSIYNFDQALANTPILLLSSNDDKLWQGYRVLQVQSSFVIESLDEQAHVKALQLKFVNDKLDQLVIFDATGQISEISLTMKASDSTPSIFEFEIPQGTHIDDQRQ